MNGARMFGIAALGAWLGLACSGPRERPSASPPTELVAPGAVSERSRAPTVASGSGLTGSSAPSAEAARADAARVARSSPVQTLNQMLTAQALLVSLLLAPVGKDVGNRGEAVARLDQPAP
jgi:hypothetical protein